MLMNVMNRSNAEKPSKLLILHGSRQVGTLLVGRMDKLRKKLQKSFQMELIAPDAPFVHPDDPEMRQWWIREGDSYQGLEQSLDLIVSTWKEHSPEGILGFSQGARMAHLLVQCHESRNHPLHLQALRYVIMCAGYDAPLPTELQDSVKFSPSELLETPSLHIYGQLDRVIVPAMTQASLHYYRHAEIHTHEGGHHIPMRAANVQAYMEFIERHRSRIPTQVNGVIGPAFQQLHHQDEETTSPVSDEEAQMAQIEEVEALSAIFPDELRLLSKKATDGSYEFPIVYQIDLAASDEGVWPPHPLALRISYPSQYPAKKMAEIIFTHDNNMLEFSSHQMEACRQAMMEAAQAELGMPSVLTCVYAAREFFESGRLAENQITEEQQDELDKNDWVDTDEASSLIKPSSPERIQECNLQGLEIARTILNKPKTLVSATLSSSVNSHGGNWKYTCGLVGKPSAGKSTFFNAATAFARQRNDSENAIGGATMAPHPFTTIDPNVGYCLVPAPKGSCPEEGINEETIGSTHGRDHLGRRLIPVMLKDVAGLVPGAYQGRGRGNQFLNDLTDADVLIHVVDASGSADTEGNAVGEDGCGSHPLQDLAWILNELIEWVFNNVMFKWALIRRKGRSKLADMFSGYGQSQAILHEILYAVEKYMETMLQCDRPMTHLEDWDEGDLHRLVSAFLGVRFPMALSLNKSDLPTAKAFVREVQDALPVHGAHIGVALSARSEMNFVRHYMLQETIFPESSRPEGVWQCLQSAMSLREPVLVFPVSDMTTYSPLPGMFRLATQDASLPSPGMIACLVAAGGSAPTQWQGGNYIMSTNYSCKLRDVLIMKPGSTVEDVFLALKRFGAMGGEFVRAEGAGNMGEKPKLVNKLDILNRSNRILKIMTNKRREWQNNN